MIQGHSAISPRFLLPFQQNLNKSNKQLKRLSLDVCLSLNPW